jgi:Mn2+/Fe2+ NRAMP family transporter
MILSLGPTLLVMSKILPRNIIQTIRFGQTIKLQQSSITEWLNVLHYNKQQLSKLLGATSVEHSLNKKTDYIDIPAK